MDKFAMNRALCAVMDKRGIQAKWLGEMVGLSKEQMSKITACDRRITAAEAANFAAALGITIETLYSGGEVPAKITLTPDYQINDTVARIVEDKGIERKTLQNRMHLGRGSINRLLDGRRLIMAEEATELAKILQVPLAELYRPW